MIAKGNGADTVKRLLARLTLSGMLTFAASSAETQKSPSTLPPPTVRPPLTEYWVLSRPILWLLSEMPRAMLEEDFYAALVSNPRFARDVGNVVVEFGGAAHQDILDRYLNGADVAFSDLRKVWTDVVGFDFPTALGYVNFFAQVRAVNLRLQPTQRIRVWLGEPPIDWSRIKTDADFRPLLNQRDPYAAKIIEQQILEKRKKALVVYGDLHLYSDRAVVKIVEEISKCILCCPDVQGLFHKRLCDGIRAKRPKLANPSDCFTSSWKFAW